MYGEIVSGTGMYFSWYCEEEELMNPVQILSPGMPPGVPHDSCCYAVYYLACCVTFGSAVKVLTTAIKVGSNSDFDSRRLSN